MTRAHINYVEGTERTTFIYRRPGTHFVPRIWAWSLVGGLAVGVGVAVALTAAGVTGVGGLGFDVALIAGTLLGGLALYSGIYRAALGDIGLRISFDYVEDAVGVRLVDAPDWRWFPANDVLEFRLARQSEGWRAGCTLIMETDSAGSVLLVLAGRDCYEESGLPHLVSRLNARLKTVAGTASSELPPPPSPASTARGERPRPARRPRDDKQPLGKQRLPDPRDVQH